MCSTTQPDKFICPNTEVFGTASFIWGVIGPQRQFSHGQIYYGLVFFFLIGAVSPIISYILMKRFPNSLMRYVNFPVIFTGIAWSEWPSYTCIVDKVILTFCLSPASDGYQLRALDHSRIHLPVLHPSP